MQAPPPFPPNGPMPRPSPEQIQQMQRQLAMDAERMGMTVPQFIGKRARRRRTSGRFDLAVAANRLQSTSRGKLPSRCGNNSRPRPSTSISISTSTSINIHTAMLTHIRTHTHIHTRIRIRTRTHTRTRTSMARVNPSPSSPGRPIRSPSPWPSSCGARTSSRARAFLTASARTCSG